MGKTAEKQITTKKSSLDLSGLDLDAEPSAIAVRDGKETRAPLNMFYEDPNQPRQEIDEEADNDLRADIKLRGVLQPITAAPPDPDGRMRIILGSRRWRLSGEAGRHDIGYVIQDDIKVFDDYAQVAENERRCNLSPLDLATFIAKRKKAGDEQKYIAAQLGMDQATITHLLVLVDGPHFVRSLYAERKCRTPKYLYELANLAKKHKEAVEKFCQESDDFSRNSITALINSLSIGNTNSKKDVSGSSSNPSTGVSSLSGEGNSPSLPGGASTDKETKQLPYHNPANEKDSGKNNNPASGKIKKPLMLGTHNEEAVMVMLHKRPSAHGLVFVKNEITSEEIEISFNDLRNLTLTESTT